MKRWTPVRVTWVDSAETSGWLHMKEGMQDICVCQCETVGFVLEDNDEFIAVALSLADRGGEHELFSQTMAIPKVAITKIQKLRPA